MATPCPRGGGLIPLDFTLADQLSGEPGRAAAFTRPAPQNELVVAVLDNGMGFGLAVDGAHLGDGLDAHGDTAAFLAEPRQSVFEALDTAEGIELVDMEPQPARLRILK